MAAKGCTLSDVPMMIRRSHFGRSLLTAEKNRPGRFSPKKTISGLVNWLQESQLGLSSFFTYQIKKINHIEGNHKSDRPTDWSSSKLIGQNNGRTRPLCCLHDEITHLKYDMQILQSFASPLLTLSTNQSRENPFRQLRQWAPLADPCASTSFSSSIPANSSNASTFCVNDLEKEEWT